MCGRFNLIASAEQIVNHFELRKLSHHEISFNIPPGQKILNVVKLEDGSYKGVNLHWGLIPSWSRDKKIAPHLINARAETISEKPSFRAAFKKRRCLIPATGFFEWQALESGKQPYHIHRSENTLFAFAGLWEHWDQPHETIYSCTIITKQANQAMLPIHHRMPVILKPENYASWLAQESEADNLLILINGDIEIGLEFDPISTRINSPTHNNAQCLL